MLGGLAQAGAKALGGGRFSLANLVPVTLLVAFVLVLATSGLYGGGDPHFSQVASIVAENPGLAVIVAFGVFLLAVLLRPFQAALVQLLEGYWDALPAASLLAEQATERHRRLLRRAETIDEFAPESTQTMGRRLGEVARNQRYKTRLSGLRGRAHRTIDRYPLRVEEVDGQLVYVDRLMPTLLGNTLRDAEDNAGRRYGLKLQIVAPRLYPSVSDKLAASISQNLDLIDTTAALCISLALAGGASLPLLPRWDAWSLVPIVAFLLSAAAYRGAIQSARVHASLLAAAVDLHRFDMIRALHYSLPDTAAEERKFNKSLTSFLADRRSALKSMGRYRYEHAAASETQPLAGAADSSAAGNGPSE